jgi:hypothetical protein
MGSFAPDGFELLAWGWTLENWSGMGCNLLGDF